MTKTDIINGIFENIGLSRNESQEIVERIFNIIKDTLISGEPVKLSGFGTFNVRKKNARIGRNPKTKQEVEIPQRKVVTFKTSSIFRKAILSNS